MDVVRTGSELGGKCEPYRAFLAPCLMLRCVPATFMSSAGCVDPRPRPRPNKLASPGRPAV